VELFGGPAEPLFLGFAGRLRVVCTPFSIGTSSRLGIAPNDLGFVFRAKDPAFSPGKSRFPRVEGSPSYEVLLLPCGLLTSVGMPASAVNFILDPGPFSDPPWAPTLPLLKPFCESSRLPKTRFTVTCAFGDRRVVYPHPSRNHYLFFLAVLVGSNPTSFHFAFDDCFNFFLQACFFS